MTHYRVLFSRSPNREESLTLVGDPAAPVWDSVDVVQHLANALRSSESQEFKLKRHTKNGDNVTAVRQLLDTLGITYLQYVIEDTGVRRTVRQSAERCSFRK